VTRTSQAIPKASHRTYAAEEPYFRMWNAEPITEHIKNQKTPRIYSTGVLKLYRGTNPSSMTKHGKYFFYDSNGTIYYEINDKNDWRQIKIKRN
jgi:hypothetical protein